MRRSAAFSAFAKGPRVLAVAAAIALVLALPVSSARAAQGAVITAAKSEIRDRPSREGEVLETKASGDRVRISSFHKDGWYRAKTSGGRIGWIWQADLAVDYDLPSFTASNLDLTGAARDRKPRPDPWLFARPQAAILGLSMAQIGGSRFDHSMFGGAMLDVAVRLGPTTRALARIGYYGTTAPGNATMSANRSGVPVLGGIEVELSRRGPWTTAVNGAGGVDFNAITVESATPANPSSISASERSLLGMASFLARYLLAEETRAVASVGAYFSPKKSRSLGKVPFLAPAGDPSSAVARFSGPFAALGIELAY